MPLDPLSGHPVSRRDFLATTAAVALVGRRIRIAAPNPAGSLVYVGTYTDATNRAGLHVLRAHPSSGALTHLGAVDVGENPSFVALHPRRPVLYAVNEVDRYDGRASGAIAAFALDGRGGATPLGRPRATGGGAPCYVSIDPSGRCALVANYGGGSVAAFPIDHAGALGAASALIQHTGRGPNAARQEAPHAHCIIPDPTGRWVVGTDLGIDRVDVYRLDPRAGTLTPTSGADQAPGSGPRHLAFHPDGRRLYVIHELDQTVSAYRWDASRGTLTPIGSPVPLLDARASGDATAADIHVAPSGRFAYASVRGPNVLCVLAIDAMTGGVKLVQRLPSGGNWPRNFALEPSGRFLYVAHQKSNDIVGFAVDGRSGRLTPTTVRLSLPSPVCLRFA